jgi:hypothetical protein
MAEVGKTQNKNSRDILDNSTIWHYNTILAQQDQRVAVGS